MIRLLITCRIAAFGLLLSVVAASLALAQDDLGKLVQERDELYQQHDHYMRQNSSLFGKKSKKDLQNIITTLQGIIDKDNEIISVVRQQNVQIRVQGNQQASSYIGQTRETMNLVKSLNSEVERLTAQVKLKTSEVTTQQAYYEAAENKVTFLSIALGVAVLGLLLMGVYVRRLRMMLHGK